MMMILRNFNNCLIFSLSSVFHTTQEPQSCPHTLSVLDQVPLISPHQPGRTWCSFKHIGYRILTESVHPHVKPSMGHSLPPSTIRSIVTQQMHWWLHGGCRALNSGALNCHRAGCCSQRNTGDLPEEEDWEGRDQRHSRLQNVLDVNLFGDLESGAFITEEAVGQAFRCRFLIADFQHRT